MKVIRTFKLPARTAALLAGCLLLASGAIATPDTSAYSCSNIYSLSTSSDQCSYVKEQCIDSLNDAYSVHLLVFYFCNPPIVKALVLVAAVLMLVGLFKGIGLTAERYFSAILSQISQDLNIPPRLAGCTLLALGNGAPDLSSSIEAIQHGHFDLALGSLVGSLMFVGCVVAGRIISLRGRAGLKELRCKAAQVRDVLALAISVACVGSIAFVWRKMTIGGVSLLLCLYAGYVLLVLVADLTKTRYGIKWTGLIGLLSGSQSGDFRGDEGWGERLQQALLPHRTRRSDGGALDSPTTECSTPDTEHSFEEQMRTSSSRRVSALNDPSPSQDLSPRRTSSAPHSLPDRNDSRIKVSESDMSKTSTMMISPFESIQEGDGTFGSGAIEPVMRATTELPSGGQDDQRAHLPQREQSAPVHQPLQGTIRPKYSQMTTTEYRARAFAAVSDVRSFHRATPLPIDEAMSILNLEDMIEAMVDREGHPPVTDPVARDVEQPRGTGSHTTTVYEVQNEALDATSHSRATASPIRGVLESLSWATGILVVPLAFLLKATIPLVANSDEYSEYSDHAEVSDSRPDLSWFVRSAALSPFFIAAYFSGGILSISTTNACIAATTGAILAVAAWKATKYPQVLDREWVAAIVGLYGFVISALWIGLIAEELVGIIHVFGVIGHIKPAVLGVTVLAWGNSLTDLLANIAIAMTAEGGVSMAMTACFAGPLFNMLLGLGIGFAMYFSATGQSEQVLTFDLISAIGTLFALVNCFSLIAMAAWYRGRLPAVVGWLMIAWYGVYMCLVGGAAMLFA